MSCLLHQSLCAVLVHPQRREVLPVVSAGADPAAGRATKNNCERNAAKCLPQCLYCMIAGMAREYSGSERRISASDGGRIDGLGRSARGPHVPQAGQLCEHQCRD